MGQLHRIWQRLKARFKARYEHGLDTPRERARSLSYAKWVDVGFLRTRWTNDGEIAPGVLRANHPTNARFDAYQKSGVTTVLCLRHDVNLAPVKLAQEYCAKIGLTYVIHKMAPRRAPTKDELLGLIALFERLEKPVLIHCKSGADRTGLAAAIWLLTMENQPLSVARKELSLKYLHRRESETGVLDAVLDLYEATGNGAGFADWVRDHYTPQAATALAAQTKIKRGFWGQARAMWRDLYIYGQHREARWHASYDGPFKTSEDIARARFFTKWIDHGVLRGFWSNRAEIIPGVYRGNHPSDARLRAEAKAGLASVINLRGASHQAPYLLEKALCADLGLPMFDLPMQASRAPVPHVLIDLFDALDTAPRPVLMHCKSGADRTGLAAALLVLDQGRSMRDARRQLSWRFLHFRRGPKAVLDRFLDAFERAQAAQPGLTIRDWIKDGYDPAALKPDPSRR